MKLLIPAALLLTSWAGAAQVPTPQISGVVNGGNFRPNAAPGELISIFGNNLATGPLAAPGLPLPTSLLQTVVYVNSVAVPLLYVSPTQINAQVPYEITTNSAATVSVSVQGVSSADAPLTIVQVAPAIFTQTGTGVGQASILNEDSTVNSSTNPAKAGSTVQIFATGLGLTMPLVADGAAGDAQKLASPATADVTIGGQNATVTFAGAAPGFAGLDQVNAVVPNVSSGNQGIVISIGTAASAANVTIAVQ